MGKSKDLGRELAASLPWTVEELEAAGLPLYGCETWVREQLESGASWGDITKRAGGGGTLTSFWCIRHFHGLIDSVINTVWQRAQELPDDGMTRCELEAKIAVQLAAQIGFSVAGVLHILRKVKSKPAQR